MENAFIKTLHKQLLFAVAFTVPLHQLLFIPVGGIVIKVYQVLLILLAVTSMALTRKGEPLWAWQKIGLAFFGVSVAAEVAGYIELLNFGELPELKDLGKPESYRGFLTFYLFLNMTFAFQVARLIREESDGMTQITTAAALGSVFPALYALYQLISVLFGFEIDFLEFKGVFEVEGRRGISNEGVSVRFSSTYFEPGPYGGYLSIVIPLTVCAIWAYQSTLPLNVRRLSLLKGVLVLDVIALFLSFSTSALIGMSLFTALVLGLNYPLSKIIKWISITVVAIAAVVTAVGLWEFLFSVFDSFLFRKLFADSSDVLSESRLARVYQTEIGLKIFLDHPIIGIGPYVPFFFEIYSPGPRAVTQAVSIVYANILTQTGIVGFSLFAAALVKIVIGLKDRLVSPVSTASRKQGVVLLGLFVSILTLFFTLGSLVAVHLWLAIGVIIGYLESTPSLHAAPQQAIS